MFLQQGFKGLNEIWRYLVGIIIILLSYFLGQFIFVYGAIYYKMSVDKSLGSEEWELFTKTTDFSIYGIGKNTGFLILLSMFFVAMIGLYLVVIKLHDKKIKDLITPFETINYRKIFFGFGLWMILSLVVEAISYVMDPGNYTFRFDAATFVPLLFISLILLPVQSSFEELFFRGYIMQGVAFLTKNKWLSMLVPSLLFGLMHATNPETIKYGLFTMEIYYISAAVFLGLITIMDDGLELALGIHAATNIFGSTLFTYEGSVLQTDSLFVSHEVKPWVMIFSFIVMAIVFMAICFKKYAWPSFTSLLLPVTNDAIDEIGLVDKK
ncbi:MAG: CPBP family intramembrane metalloprotease [Saprospiraceae bacterium]|nr:CPBP family intramembrane metalloprotease [Saprospiraceae bacterium]